jgi:hypothetical protein
MRYIAYGLAIFAAVLALAGPTARSRASTRSSNEATR